MDAQQCGEQARPGASIAASDNVEKSPLSSVSHPESRRGGSEVLLPAQAPSAWAGFGIPIRRQESPRRGLLRVPAGGFDHAVTAYAFCAAQALDDILRIWQLLISLMPICKTKSRINGSI